MPVETRYAAQNADGTPSNAGNGKWLSAMGRGAMLRCPNCSERTLFTSYLKVAERCGNCGEDFHHHRADDAPPYFAIFIAAHILIPAILLWERFSAPPLWLQALVWLPVSVIVMMALLPPTKGALVGLQWALGMHGFDPDTTAPESESAQIRFDANGSIRRPE